MTVQFSQSLTKEGTVDLLQAVAAGKPAAEKELMDRVYTELKRLARKHLRMERANHTLCTTALVHEAYMKLTRLDRIQWQSRSHFLAIAAQAMRNILIDYAKRRNAAKRDGGLNREQLEDWHAITDQQTDQLLIMHDLLEKLAESHSRHVKVVECRFFAGMNVDETAEALNISPATVKRDWAFSRAWLNRAMKN